MNTFSEKNQVAEDVEIPDELRQFLELQKAQAESQKEKKEERLRLLGSVVAKLRDEAIVGRKTSGIEIIWKEDNEFYEGIDDANRSSESYTKSQSVNGGLQQKTNDSDNRCTAFFNIIRQFVDSASARMGDILLPAGDWNFSISPTPVPELSEIKESQQPILHQGQPIPADQSGRPMTVGDFAAGEIATASAKVKKAETRIRDWLTECQFHVEERKAIESAARLGTGILKGPFPEKRVTRNVVNGALEIAQTTVPASRCIDLENFFPDPNCGENIQNGGYVFEREFLTARQLRSFKGMDGFQSDAIDKILKEGPGKRNIDSTTSPASTTKDNDRFEVWYFHGDIDFEDIEILDPQEEKDELDNLPGGEDEEEMKDPVPAVVVLVNDTVIKGDMEPLDNGEFPYDVMCWQRMHGAWTGIGIARQGRTPQKMLNSSGRALMDNMGLSAIPMWAIRQEGLNPIDGQWQLAPGKGWLITAEAGNLGAKDMIGTVDIPTRYEELVGTMQLASKMMEDATGVTFLLQGQQGSAPDTVGGMELLHKNASALLRRVARVFDENITEPHIRRYYDWLMMHSDDEEEKGDLMINAVGSSALVEREIQAMQAQQILQMSLNPIFEMSPKKAKDEVLRAWRFEPSRFDMDEAEKEKIRTAQPAPPPQIAAAQIRAQSAEKIAQMDNQIQIQKVQSDTDRDNVHVQSQIERDKALTQALSEKTRIEYESNMAELQLRERLAIMDYANRNQMQLNDVKAQLSQTSMKLTVQKELATSAGVNAPQVIKPPMEPRGRAPNGEAYQR